MTTIKPATPRPSAHTATRNAEAANARIIRVKYPLDLRPIPNVRAIDARALLARLGETS